MFGVYLINDVIYQLTQSQWLYCSDVEDEVFCLILLPSTKGSHHPVQIAINMSRKTTIAQHETVCHIAAPFSDKNLQEMFTFLSHRHMSKTF